MAPERVLTQIFYHSPCTHFPLPDPADDGTPLQAFSLINAQTIQISGKDTPERLNNEPAIEMTVVLWLKCTFMLLNCTPDHPGVNDLANCFRLNTVASALQDSIRNERRRWMFWVRERFVNQSWSFGYSEGKVLHYVKFKGLKDGIR